MRKLALVASLGAALVAVSGCARWTLRPLHAPHAADNAQSPERFGALTSLMQSQTQSGDAAAQALDPAAARSLQEGLEGVPPELAIARLSERQGDEEHSRKLYQAYIDKHPQHPLPHHRLGVMAARRSKLDEAEQHLRRALELAPPSVELLSDMGYLCYLQSRFDEAEHFFLQALEQSPDSASATNNLALVYGARGDFDKSLRYFRRVNNEAESHANVAYAMTQKGLLEDARNEYLRALTIDKSLRSAAHALVQLEQARKAAQDAAQRHGESPQPADRGDVIELSSGRAAQPQAASAAFELASAPKPTPPVPAPPAPSAGSADALVGRLMPLPNLPEQEQALALIPPVAADGEETIARPVPTDQREQAAPQIAIDRPAATRPHSRFTGPATAMPPTSLAGELPEPAATPNVFAAARQVNWEESEKPASTTVPHRYRNVIPIPTSPPTSDSSGQVQQALAVQPAEATKPDVRPASAVQMGLSDDGAAEAAAQPPSVRTQFSDFGSAPARLRSTVGAVPLEASP